MIYRSVHFLCILVVLSLTTVEGCFFPYIVSKKSPYSDWVGACDILKPSVVSRLGWDAKSACGVPECFSQPVQYVIVHHTATPPCSTYQTCAQSVRDLQKDHINEKKWLDIGYHFLIGGDGKIYEGRPFYRVGAHTKYHNKKSIGIALIGDFDKEAPSTQMLDLIPQIAYCGVEKGIISKKFKIIGHRDAYCTNCPGDALYNIIKTWPRFPDKVPIPSYTCDATTAAPTTTTPAPTTTTPAPTTTTPAPTTTTPAPTTTTPAPTTPAPTTEAPTTEKPEKPWIYYVLLSKQKAPWFDPWW